MTEESPDPDLNAEEWEILYNHAVELNHPGKDCPCQTCLVQYP